MSTLKKPKKVSSSKSSPLNDIARMLQTDPEWVEQSQALLGRRAPEQSIHLAVFVSPFLEYVLLGHKTIESRFSMVRCPPYGRVARGDLVLLKESGGPVVGICEIGAAWFYHLTKESWKTIRREFAKAICAEDPEFWRSRAHAEYASLMYVSRVKSFSPVAWPKRDRRGWVIVQEGSSSPLFGDTMKTSVLGFSGGIASGKTTVSEAVANSLGCARVSFGSYMRGEARRRGTSEERESLQAIGEELVAADPDALCKSVLAQSGWRPGQALVVDGIRHVDIAERIRRLVKPSDFQHVHLAVSDKTRANRLNARGEDRLSLSHVDSHSTEAEVYKGLPERADFVVDGNLPLEEIIERVSRWAQKLP